MIVIFEIENHFSLAKWPPLLSVASSASEWSNVSVVIELFGSKMSLFSKARACS